LEQQVRLKAPWSAFTLELCYNAMDMVAVWWNRSAVRRSNTKNVSSVHSDSKYSS